MAERWMVKDVEHDSQPKFYDSLWDVRCAVAEMLGKIDEEDEEVNWTVNGDNPHIVVRHA